MSKNKQNIYDFKIYLDQPHIDSKKTCQYCFSPFADPQLIQKKFNQPKIIETKDFYKPILKLLTCVKCNGQVHELCHNDQQKKKSTNTFQCILCTEQDHQEKQCVVCQNNWGMKKVFYSNGKKKYIHLICAYYDPNFHFNSFKNKEIQKIEFKQIQNTRKMNCVICDKLIKTQASATCNFCTNEHAHLSCLMYTQTLIQDLSLQDASRIQQFSNPIPQLNLHNILSNFNLEFEDKDQLLEFIQNNLEFKTKDKEKESKQQKLQSFVDYFCEQLKHQPIQQQLTQFKMLCKDCRQTQFSDIYCCNNQIQNKTMVMCDICCDWIHVPHCDKNNNTTIFNKEDDDKGYYYYQKNIQDYNSEDSYICKCCEDVAFYFNKMKKDRKIDILSKPKYFIHYFLISIKLESIIKSKKEYQEKNFELIISELQHSIYYKSIDYQLQYRIKEEYLKFQQRSDIGFFFDSYTNLFQKRFDDINIAYEFFYSKNIQFLDQLKKKNNQNQEQQSLCKKKKKILKIIIKLSQQFLENPSRKNLNQIKFFLSDMLQKKEIETNISFFIHCYIDFLKIHFIGPLDECIREFDLFFQNNSNDFDHYYRNQFEQQLRKYNKNNVTLIDGISLKKYIHAKIPYDKFYNLIQNFEKNSQYDRDCSYENMIDKKFEDMEIKEIEKIIERMINCDFRLSDSKMNLVDEFLNEYINFFENQQEIMKLKRQLTDLKQKLQEKDFLRQKSNLSLFLTLEDLQVYKQSKYGQKLIKYYLKKFYHKDDNMQPQYDVKFVEDCKKIKGSLKQVCKRFLRDIGYEKPVISEKAQKYLEKCNKEYEIEELLNSGKVLLNKDLEELKIQMTSNKHISDYLRMKIDYVLTLQKKLKTLAESKIKAKQINEFSNLQQYIDDAYEFCKSKRIQSDLIQDFKYNIQLCEKIDFTKTNNVDLEEQNLNDQYIDELIQQLDNIQFYKEFISFPLKKLRYFINDKIKQLYTKFREQQMCFIFQPKYRPPLSLVEKILNNVIPLQNDEIECQYFQNFQKRVEIFKKKIHQTAIDLIKNTDLFQNPNQTLFDIDAICRESNHFQIDDSNTSQMLIIFSQLRVQLQVQKYVNEFLDINSQKNPSAFYQENEKVYKYLYKSLQSHLESIKKRENSKKKRILNPVNIIQENQFRKFISQYRCMQEINNDIKKMIAQKVKICNSLPSVFADKFKEKEADKIIYKMLRFQFFFKDFYQYITEQKKQLCQICNHYCKLLEQILTSDIKNLLEQQDLIKLAIESINGLHIKNETLENHYSIFNCILDFIKSNGDSFTQFQQFYDEILRQLERSQYANLQQFQFVQSLNELKKKFEDVKQNLERIQEFEETHKTFQNYLILIDEMVNPELNEQKYFCCFSYQNISILQDEIKVCKQLINDQYDEYFRIYHKKEKPGFVGSIQLSDRIKCNIENKLNSVNKLNKFLTTNYKDTKNLTLEEKIGLYSYVQKVCYQCMNIVQDEYILNILMVIESARKMIEGHQREIQKNLQIVIMKVYDFLNDQVIKNSNFYQQVIPDLDLKIQNVCDDQNLLYQEKIQYLTLCWHYKVIKHFMLCCNFQNHKDYFQFYKTQEFNTLQELMSQQEIISETSIRIYCIMSMNFVTSWILLFVQPEERQEIISQWKYKHEYELVWNEQSIKENFYDRTQELNNIQLITSNKFKFQGKQNFLKAILQTQKFFENNTQKYVKQINKNFEERVTGKDQEKNEQFKKKRVILKLLLKHVFQNSKTSEFKYIQMLQKNFVQKYLVYINKQERDQKQKFQRKTEKFLKNIGQDIESKKEFFNKKFSFEYALEQIKNIEITSFNFKSEFENDDSVESEEQNIVNFLDNEFKQNKKKNPITQLQENQLQKYKQEVISNSIDINMNQSLYQKQEYYRNELKFNKFLYNNQKLSGLKFYTNYNIDNLNFANSELYFNQCTTQEDKIFKNIKKQYIDNLIRDKNHIIILGWLEFEQKNEFIEDLKQLQKNELRQKVFCIDRISLSLNFFKYQYLNHDLQNCIQIQQDYNNSIFNKEKYAFILYRQDTVSKLLEMQKNQGIIKEEIIDQNIDISNNKACMGVDDPEFQIIYNY